jgi:hypothetical protein
VEPPEPPAVAREEPADRGPEVFGILGGVLVGAGWGEGAAGAWARISQRGLKRRSPRASSQRNASMPNGPK